MITAPNVVVLAGGVGGAKTVAGFAEIIPPENLTVVVNTGDDIVMHGVLVCPDLDTITYTLGGGVHQGQGWGRQDERFTVSAEMTTRYGAPSWFTLGDRDIATHLTRHGMLHQGRSLSQATAAITSAWGLNFTVLPMSDEPCPTYIESDGRQFHFQEWWVAERGEPRVDAIDLFPAGCAVPAPGVLEAIRWCDVVVLATSNPVVSINPILTVPGIRDAVAERPVVGISPIVGDSVVRGMADRLLPVVGAEVSAAGVARWYGRDVLDAWVLDTADADSAAELRSDGFAVAVTETMMGDPVMADPSRAARVARTALDLIDGRDS